MTYRENSGWNDKAKLLCLQAMKKAETAGFPHGMATDLARELVTQIGLDEGTLKAKIGNYKSLAGHTRPTNASQASQRFFDQFGNKSVIELQKVIDQTT